MTFSLARHRGDTKSLYRPISENNFAKGFFHSYFLLQQPDAPLPGYGQGGQGEACQRLPVLHQEHHQVDQVPRPHLQVLDQAF